nr:PqqD family peptide modification chaperone [Motilibacter aurantiacus]
MISAYSPCTDEVAFLNSTASDVWRLADGEHTAEELTALLAAAYGTTADALRDDVGRLLDGLVAAGLLPGPGRPRPAFSLRALDVPMRLLVDDPELGEVLERLWADCAAAPCGERGVTVRVTGTGPWHVASPAHTVQARTLAEAVGEACAAVNLSAVAATPLLAYHAAVLSLGRSTLAVPGVSGAGKSTLTAALLLEGWELVSDEALALPWHAGPPAAYPRPLALSDWSRRALDVDDRGVEAVGERFVRAVDLGALASGTPGPVTDVLLLRRAEGPPRLAPADRTEALRALLPRGFTSVQSPGAALRTIADVLAQARTWGLRLGDPRRAAQLVTEALGPPGLSRTW